MSAPVRILAFSVAVLVAAAGGALLGTAVGPIDTASSHGDPAGEMAPDPGDAPSPTSPTSSEHGDGHTTTEAP